MGTFLTRKMSQTRQRKKKPVSAELQEQRDNRRKERNRAAARKCREKRDNQIRYLEDQKEKLMMTNQGIKNENEQMIQEINYLRSLHEHQQNDTTNTANNNEPELEGFNDILADPDHFLEQSELGPIFAMCE